MAEFRERVIITTASGVPRSKEVVDAKRKGNASLYDLAFEVNSLTKGKLNIDYISRMLTWLLFVIIVRFPARAADLILVRNVRLVGGALRRMLVLIAVRRVRAHEKQSTRYTKNKKRN